MKPQKPQSDRESTANTTSENFQASKIVFLQWHNMRDEITRDFNLHVHMSGVILHVQM